MKNHKTLKLNNIRHHEINIISFKENVFLQKLCSSSEKSEKNNGPVFFLYQKNLPQIRCQKLADIRRNFWESELCRVFLSGIQSLLIDNIVFKHHISCPYETFH